MMEWDAATWLKLISVVWPIAGVVAGGYIRLLLRRLDKLEEQVKDLEDKRARSVGELKDNVAQMRAIIDHTPSKDDFHTLALSLSNLNGDMGKAATKIEGLVGALERIENYLIDRSK